MKVFRRVMFIILGVLLMFCMVACGGNKTNNGGGSSKGGGKKEDPKPTTKILTPSDITVLKALTDYGAARDKYSPTPKEYDSTPDARKYDNQDANDQYLALKARIEEKYDDVISGDADSSFIKIFAMSDADELLNRMAQAALTYDEMNRVVDYLSGDVEDADVSSYISKEEEGVWTGTFADQETGWRDEKNDDAYFNEGWSFFDDWDLYDRLKDYAKDKSVVSKSKPRKSNGNPNYREDFEKDLADDNAAWQYRSILEKVYTEVQLPGAAAARLATYMLDYAVEIVEEKSGGSPDNAITGETEYQYGPFVQYCKAIPVAADPFSGLADYDTASYLLAFNDYYAAGDGLQDCVTLYGYYYDYNEKYYNVALADEDEYANQLKYEKMSKFSDDEWLDYVSIQRKNYVGSYRYDKKFYRTFYETHFEFQTVVESYDKKIYDMKNVVESKMDNVLFPQKTYTSEMRMAIEPNGSIDGVMGQLTMSDWMWCYSGNEANMKSYNKANSDYEDGKASENKEKEYKGKFYYEMEQLKIVYYLLDNMKENEMDSALYYQVYAYSASLIDHMYGNIKNYVYIDDGVEPGSTYTTISAEVLDRDATQANVYAEGKINTIYFQTKKEWGTGVDSLAADVTNQSWDTMKEEINTAMTYKYDDMTYKDETEWKEKCERLEDLVIARVWSCCGQKVSEAKDSECETGHTENDDGTVATKDYDTSHKISQFVSSYEKVLYHIAGQSKVSFNTYAVGYKTKEATPIATSKTWQAGYFGNMEELNASNEKSPFDGKGLKEQKVITISSGEVFVDEIDGEDKDWWDVNKTGGQDTNYPAATPETGELSQESYGVQQFEYYYRYEFMGWYLDQNFKYEFDEADEIGVNLNAYAGYRITKEKKN